MSICRECKVEKPEEAFSMKRGKRDTRCKSCHNQYYKEYWQKSEAYDKHKKRVSKANRLAKLNSFGLTEEQVSHGFNNPCELCGRRLAVAIDHDHLTGNFRGFLCMSCNTGLGKLGDTLDRLREAVVYLENKGL